MEMETDTLDISSNNHRGVPFNWQAAFNAGYKAVYVKATQNNDYVNPYLIADCRDAKNAGFEVGIYHFYGSTKGIASPQEQADWFKRNGIEQVAEYTTLHPVVDVEVGEPGEPYAATIETFINLLTPLSVGVYMNRSFQEAMPQLDSNFLWLAWPGWTDGPVPTHTAMVQFEQVVVAGIGEGSDGSTSVTDVSRVLDATAIGIVPNVVPIDPIKEDITNMVSTVELANGDIVTYVLLPSNEHLLEFTRKAGTAGETAANGNMSIIDITAQFPKLVPA